MMRLRSIILLALVVFAILLPACGKVSNETGSGPSAIPVYMTSIVGQVPVHTKMLNDEFYLTPSDNTMIVSLGLINKDGGQTMLAWGRGEKLKVPTLNAVGRTINDYKSMAYNVDSANITKASVDDILVKWVHSDGDHWEYYLMLESMDNATYMVNFMTANGSRMASIAFDGKHVSENVHLEFSPPTQASTLWSRVLLADESKNIVKKSILSIAGIKSSLEKVYATLKYTPKDLRVKKFSVANPKLNYPTDDTLEFYLSEILVNQKRGPNYLVSYLNEVPREVIPTATMQLIRDTLK